MGRVWPRWALGVALLLLPVLVGLFHGQRYWALTVDDAAISFTYARNLAEGQGLVLQPGGERIEAYSNPLWVGLLALLHRVQVPLEAGAKVLGLLLALAALLFFPVVLQRLAGPVGIALGRESSGSRVGQPGQSTAPLWLDLLAATAALITAATPAYFLWAVSGLESGLHAFLLVLLLWRLLVEDQQSVHAGSAVLLLLLLLTRPEAPLYGAIALGFKLLAVWQAPAEVRGRQWRPLGHWLALVGIGCALLFGGRWWYFDQWLPNSFYIKQISFAFEWWAPLTGSGAGWRYLAGFFTAKGLLIFLPFLLLGLIPGPARRSYLLGLALLGAGCYFPLHVGGDWMPEHRFLAPLLPLYLVLAFAGLGRLMVRAFPSPAGTTTDPAAEQPETLARPIPGWFPWALVLFVLVAFLGRLTQIRVPTRTSFHDFTTLATVAERGRAFGELAAHVNLSHATLLDPDLGGTSFKSGLQVYDLFGLADRMLPLHRWDAPLVREYFLDELRPSFIHLHGAWLSAYYFQEYPEVNQLYAPLSRWPLGRGGGLPDLGPGLHLLLREAVAVPWTPVKQERLITFGNSGLQLMDVDLGGAGLAPGGTQPILLHVLVSAGWIKGGGAPAWTGGSPEVEIQLVPRSAGERERHPGPVLRQTAPVGGPLYPPAIWQAGERLRLLVRLTVAATTPPGRYRVLVGLRPHPAGELLPAQNGEPLVAVGEVDVGAAAVEEGYRNLLTGVREALTAARQDRQRAATRRLLFHDDGRGHPEVVRARYAVAAAMTSTAVLLGTGGDLETAAVKLRQAMEFAPDLPSVARTRRALVDRLQAEGLRAQQVGDHERAHQLLRAAVSLEPGCTSCRTALERSRGARDAQPQPLLELVARQAGLELVLSPSEAKLHQALRAMAETGRQDAGLITLCPREGCATALPGPELALVAAAYRRLGDLSTALSLLRQEELPRLPLDAGLLRQELLSLHGLQARPGEVDGLLARIPGSRQVALGPDLLLRGLETRLDRSERLVVRAYFHRTGASVGSSRELVRLTAVRSDATTNGQHHAARVEQVRSRYLPGGRLFALELPIRLPSGRWRVTLQLGTGTPAAQADLGTLEVNNPNLTFELGTLAGWEAQGPAFARATADTGRVPGQQLVTGYQGRVLLNGYAQGGDPPQGTLRSAPFQLRQPVLSLLVGGGQQPGKLGVRLLIGDRVVAEVGGQGTDRLSPVTLDVRRWSGQEARLELFDRVSGGWGHLLFDDVQQLAGPAAGIPLLPVGGGPADVQVEFEEEE